MPEALGGLSLSSGSGRGEGGPVQVPNWPGRALHWLGELHWLDWETESADLGVVQQLPGCQVKWATHCHKGVLLPTRQQRGQLGLFWVEKARGEK